jgi:hypothetical protein
MRDSHATFAEAIVTDRQAPGFSIDRIASDRLGVTGPEWTDNDSLERR